MPTEEEYLQNKRWVERFCGYFALLDFDKDGIVSREDWLAGVDRIGTVITDHPAAIAKLRETTFEFATAFGLTKGVKAEKQKFLRLAAAWAVGETARAESGKESLLEKLLNAAFDVVDKNYDGYVTFEEFETVQGKGYNYEPEMIKASFAKLDKNKNGKIERKEFLDAEFKFWVCLDDPDVLGMFGDKLQ